MSSFVITKRNRNGVKVYLTRPGSLNTWTSRKSGAWIFETRAEAAAHEYPDENETIEEL